MHVPLCLSFPTVGRDHDRFFLSLFLAHDVVVSGVSADRFFFVSVDVILDGAKVAWNGVTW